jgi:hypothetical protein
MDAGPFTIEKPEPAVIPKSEIQPAKKLDESKID